MNTYATLTSQMAQTTQGTQERATEHPHVVQMPGMRGGRPHVRGTGLTIALIARFHRMGVSPDELLTTYPQISPAGLYDALSYYHDHRDEIDQQIDGDGGLEQLQKRLGFSLGEKGRVIFSTPHAR